MCNGSHLLCATTTAPLYLGVKIRVKWGSWARFGFQLGRQESQKTTCVGILDCWLNTQHGWGLILSVKGGRPSLSLTIPMRVVTT